MKPATRLLSGFFAPTTTSADSPISHGQGVQTQTNATPCPVIEIDLYRVNQEEVPAGHLTIEEFVEQSERDRDQKLALEQGRQWVANTFYKNEPETMRSLRLKKGLSQARLASLAKTTQAHIARIENGSTDCQVGTLQRVAHALGLDVLVTIKAFLSLRNETTNQMPND